MINKCQKLYEVKALIDYKFLILQTLMAHVLLTGKQSHTASTEKDRLKTIQENMRQTH